MTTLDDGVAELLANPREQTVHRQFADRVTEESPDPRRALVDLVLAHKQSDGPRLAFACFCEANGQADRAEFIRVQCELERAPSFRTPEDCPLRRRERDLWGQSVWKKLRREGCERLPDARPWLFEVRRGFIAELTCTAERFFANADEILSEHPVEKVTLTSGLVPWGATPLKNGRAAYQLLRGLGKGLRRGRPVELPTAGTLHTEIIRAVLEAEFPGIAFELPVYIGGMDVARGPSQTVTTTPLLSAAPGFDAPPRPQ